MKWRLALTSAILALGGQHQPALAADVSDCSCGFFDPVHDQVWTDSLIVYFNETQGFPDEFNIQDYTHNREYGWNSLYRQGALTENAQLAGVNSSAGMRGDQDSLQLWIDQSHGNHLVYGSGIEAKRQDIRFGTFMSSMRGPQQNTGGSAMSMQLRLNRTSFIEVDMCNMNNNFDARFLQLKDGEFPDLEYALNYTIFANASNATVPHDPWGFVETRMDWTKKHVNWTIQGNHTRESKRNRVDLSEPLPLIFKHWSIGDKYYMAGPPTTRNEANVAWVRAFFNSSLTTKEEQQDFDNRCLGAQMCPINDLTLRGSTAYKEKALVPYKEPPASKSWRIDPAIISGSFFAFGCLTLINVLFRRAPWKLLLKRNRNKASEYKEPDLSSPSPFVLSLLGLDENGEPVTLRKASQIQMQEKKQSVVSVHEDRQGSLADFRKRSTARWVNPFNAEDKVDKADFAFATGNRNSRHFSSTQPTDWRRKSLAYHGSLPDVVPVTSQMGRKTSVAFAVAEHGDDYTARPRRQSAFQSIRQRTASTLQAIGEVVASGLTSAEEQQRIKPIELQEGLLSKDDTDHKIRFEEPESAVEQLYPPAEQREFENYNRRRSTRTRQMSVLDRHRDLHFAGSAQNRMSRPSVSMKDWNTKEWNVQTLSEVNRLSTIDPLHDSQIPSDRRITLAEAVPVAAVDMPVPKAKEHETRINYLAGLVAFSSLGVTLIHFFLSFLPFAGGLNYGQHYKSEYWARWTVTPAILNPIWLGPFFVTSCRFLAARFLRDGDLSMIAEKMLLRAPRLVIPCVIVAALEYFFLEQGLLQWLLYLPSITWSEWAFISNYNNFGVYLNSMLELLYLIPNTAPQVVSHYCVGVLWSIPVQLQYSFVTLLAVVMIRDIRTLWKRFAFYSFCIVANWYSLSWGSCFWAGLMLADLQVTYKFSAKIQAMPFGRWIFCMVMWAIAIASAAMTLLEDRNVYPVMSRERNIHPDFYTGKPLGETTRGGYPLYFEPRLNTLTFAIAMQMLVETSTWFQAFLSMRVWQPIFPHAFTIYLIHGFIWWSLGSYMVVLIGSHGTPYWATLLATAIVCYFTLALTVLALSFLTETVTSAACRNIARWAMEPAVPKQRTLEPFSPNLFLERNGPTDGTGDEEAPRPTLLPDEKHGTQHDEIRWNVGGERRPTLINIAEEEDDVDPKNVDSMDGSSKGSVYRPDTARTEHDEFVVGSPSPSDKSEFAFGQAR